MDALQARNRDLLQRGLDLVTQPLHDALAAEFTRGRGSRWLQMLADEDRRRHEPRNDDLSALLDTALRQPRWDQFARRFGREAHDVRNHLGLLKGYRNRLAHDNTGDDWPADNVLAGLHSVRTVLAAVGADDPRADTLYEECVRRLTAPAASPQPDPAQDTSRLDELAEQVTALSGLLRDRPDDDDRLSRTLDEIGSLRGEISAISDRVASPHRSDGLDEVRAQLERLEARISQQPAADPQPLVDALLSMKQQMQSLKEDAQPPSPPGLQQQPPPTRALQAPQAPRTSGGSRQPARHGKRWTSTEDRKLLKGWRSGATIADLATELRRAPTAVSGRLRTKHEVDWALTAPHLPEVDDSVGWQGLSSWVSVALRRGCGLELIFEGAVNDLYGCLVEDDGTIVVGQTSWQDEQYLVSQDQHCVTASQANAAAQELIGGPDELAEATVTHVLLH